MDNENVYNDENFTRHSTELDSAIGGMWAAGASLDDIETTINNAFDNHLPEGSRVSATVIVGA